MTTTFPGVPPGWYILCRAHQLRAKPRRFMFAGRALVAFRTGGTGGTGDTGGTGGTGGTASPGAASIGVLDDYCAHRGAPLSGGTVCGASVQCPYHGWAYDAQGQLTSLPALAHCKAAKAMPGQSRPGQIGVTAYPALEQQGFIWIKVGQCAAPAPRQFAHYQETGWTSFIMQTRFTGTVEACLENFLDCPHATFVHRYWFRAPTQKIVKAVVRTLPDGAEAEFFEEPREKSVVWAMLAPKGGSMQHTDRFIAPNTSQVDYAFPSGLHYVITSSCTPINERETLVHTVMTFRYGSIGLLVRLFFEPLSRWIIAQDVKMLALQQHNLAAFQGEAPGQGHGAFHSTEADLLGGHIIAWRKALLRGEVPPVAGQERWVDMTL